MEKRIIPARLDCLDDATGFVEQILERAGFSEEKKLQVHLVVEEIFVNIASYAYENGNGKMNLRIEETEDPHTVEITFTDSGIPYDPLAKDDPDVTLTAEERQIGGLGIFMFKKMMDDVRYEYKDGKNVLTLIKNL